MDQFGVAAVRSSLKLVDYLPSHAAAIENYIENYKSVATC